MPLQDYQLLVGTIGGVQFKRENPSESYVEIPPAYVITDSHGGMWSLGSKYRTTGAGNLEFNVIRNDIDLDEYAQKIIYRGGKVRIYGEAGWRVWTGRSFI